METESAHTNSLWEPSIGFLVHEPQEMAQGCAGLSPSICQSDNGYAWLQGPMPVPAASHPKKGCSSEKKSHTLPGTVDFHPCRPVCPELPISKHRTCTCL